MEKIIKISEKMHLLFKANCNKLIHICEGKYSLLMIEKITFQEAIEIVDILSRVESNISKKAIIELRGEIDDLRV